MIQNFSKNHDLKFCRTKAPLYYFLQGNLKSVHERDGAIHQLVLLLSIKIFSLSGSLRSEAQAS